MCYEILWPKPLCLCPHRNLSIVSRNYSSELSSDNFKGNYCKLLQRFLSRNAMIRAVYAVVMYLFVCVCVLSVCDNPELYQNG